MKVSVISVTYNCVTVVKDCLRSVQSQSSVNVEHIVVDGASNDGTLAVLESCRSGSTNVVSEPDAGIYDGMNKGISLASGDILGFLNGDDFYAHERVLRNVVQCFAENPSIDACYSDLVYVDQYDTSRLVRYWRSGPFVAGSFSRGWCPPHPTFFVRRSVYERFGGFDLSYHIAADVELMLRFLESNKLRVKYVSDVWVKMRMGGTTNRSLRNVWAQNREVLRALNSHHISANPLLFFANKLWSRGLQFALKPTE